MTKNTQTVDMSSFTTDAKFRSFCAAGETMLAACGLTRTADTGQINTATVTKPVATNTKAGYSIWAFADSLQATKPIYIRFDYGSGAVASGNGASTWITVGTGTNGSGTITGLVLGPLQSGISNSTAFAATGMVMQATHSTAIGYLFVNFGDPSTTAIQSCGYYILERTKDSSGNSTGDGVGLTTMLFNSPMVLRDYSINFTTTSVFSTSRNLHCGAISTAYSLTSGGAIALFPHYIGAGVPYKCVGRLSYFSGDQADGTMFTSTPVGSTSHTYQTIIASTLPLTNADTSASANIKLASLWED